MNEKLIANLEKLLALHHQLYKVAFQKTDLLKKNDIEALKETLNYEQKFVQAISQMEAERIELTSKFLGRTDELTLMACIEKADGSNKEKLQNIYDEFKKVMGDLKNINNLNKQLTQQALQLVSITINTMMPQEGDHNYQKPDKKNGQAKRRSIFDSKA
ncbi:flagellar protein FlgN [Metabacillus fastidiosus]|uniref:flagellar protein FlgN n=1 Tax=Metabacillus fastidiosus TaxID=1458 RepID=UPI002E1A3A7D|nr:flagellar protein FlgN [Metabacillus fastidiosus]